MHPLRPLSVWWPCTLFDKTPPFPPSPEKISPPSPNNTECPRKKRPFSLVASFPLPPMTSSQHTFIHQARTDLLVSSSSLNGAPAACVQHISQACFKVTNSHFSHYDR
eukprot:c598_g1_i1 orf=396-719(+)